LSERGIFTISLDFELNWGIRGHDTNKGYGPNILGAREAVPAMLELFAKYGIHATWATVGFLFFGEKSELLRGLPDRRPAYVNKRRSPYEYGYIDGIGENEEEDPYHYAAGLVRKILSTPGQELGSHSFSHYFCMEEGQTPADFRADIEAAVSAAKRYGVDLRSFVFSINQYTTEYVDVLREAGFTSYRGTENSSIYNVGPSRRRSSLVRLTRFADHYINISGHNTYSSEELRGEFPLNIPSSRMLKPYRKAYRILEPLRMRRITSGLDHAARTGRLFHMWWHPHNFGRDQRENLSFLEGVLEHFSVLRKRYGMRSMTMEEVADAMGGGIL